MEIEDFLAAFHVAIGMRASDKRDLLQELARRAAFALALDADFVASALLQREQLGSTGNRRRHSSPPRAARRRRQAVRDAGSPGQADRVRSDRRRRRPARRTHKSFGRWRGPPGNHSKTGYYRDRGYSLDARP
jgi:hypothetical protein